MVALKTEEVVDAVVVVVVVVVVAVVGEVFAVVRLWNALTR